VYDQESLISAPENGVNEAMMLRKSCFVISMCVVWLAINSFGSMAMFM
jgi:hypothetical protein